MKKATLIAAALVCAHLLATGIATAQQRTPVAGFSPNLAAPQPATAATLTTDANRLIRWQGWLDVDAFSVSILSQIQKQLGSGIELGKFTLAEPSIADAVRKAANSDPTFVMNDALEVGEDLKDVKLYVWTYRHNYADTGLYQLYVSAKGKMLIGTGHGTITERVPHRDIQSLGYEFGNDFSKIDDFRTPVYADVTIWRGAVVRVDTRGVLEFVGNEAGVVVGPQVDEFVASAPISDWERAPSLEKNPNYNPRCATGAAYVAPLDRKIPITENSVQKASGDVPTGTVRTRPAIRLGPVVFFRHH